MNNRDVGNRWRIYARRRNEMFVPGSKKLVEVGKEIGRRKDGVKRVCVFFTLGPMHTEEVGIKPIRSQKYFKVLVRCMYFSVVKEPQQQLFISRNRIINFLKKTRAFVRVTRPQIH